MRKVGPQRKASKTNHGRQKLRIIGGQWRSRKLDFPDLPGLRPTTDRVRETVFNWLQPYVNGATCIDLFAGSGALGLEALSREAKSVTFVDASSVATQLIQQHLRTLGANNGTCINADALSWLKQTPEQPVDIVFLDPPFRQSMLEAACLDLGTNNWVKKGSLIYIEAESELTPLPVPPNWLLLKEKTAGQLRFCLFQVIEPND